MMNETKAKLEKICKCDRIISDIDIIDFYDLSKYNKNEKDIDFDYDEYNEDFEDEFFKLSYMLDLTESTHSLTKIETNLPSCLKYGFRSGLSHIYMRKFSPLTRGHQGPAVAVAAIATAFLIKPQCWNELVIDQVIEDGDTYYIDSYQDIKIDDRRKLTLLDFKRDLEIQKTHRIYVKIDDPIYAGTFRSETPKELHVAKALYLFFKKYDAGVLTSPVLNIAIWKNAKYFHIFDSQPRLDNCDITDPDRNGTAKLILVQNLSGVLFIILQKSNIKNENFTLYGITVVNVKKISALSENDEKSLNLPQRRPSGYFIQETFRAVAQGSYHLNHPIFPEEFHGRGHLIVAVAALIYSKLLSASKWTKAIIDLILNYSNIYLTDIVRVLGKKLDNTFEMKVSDLLTDIIFGVYTAKIKIEENVIPGQDTKSKTTLESGIRQFFVKYSLGILEIKKIFYSVWKEKNKFYFLDPFACDNEGFRVCSDDPTEIENYQKAASCIIMNSSVNQLVEMIVRNTESTDKESFVIHGLNVLYVKSGNSNNEKVVFREKKTNCRPQLPSPPSTVINESCNLENMSSHPRFEKEFSINEKIQYPELMNHVELFVVTFDESNTSGKKKVLCAGVSYYQIVKPHRLILKGTLNCLDEEFKQQARGKQGLTIAISALTQTKQLKLTDWTSVQIDKIIKRGHVAYEKLAALIIKKLEKENPTKEKKENQESTKKKCPKGLNHLDLSMLPETIKIGDVVVSLVLKINILEGEANPLVNLSEAFERYFQQFNELILENKKFMYSILKSDDKYFILNPYGTDEDGWHNKTKPAALFVVDSIKELIDFCYGLLEYNDYHFIFHFIQITIQSPDNNDTVVNLPKFEVFEKYKTKFLPITDDDYAELKEDEKSIILSTYNDPAVKDSLVENKNRKITKNTENNINEKNKILESVESSDNKDKETNIFNKAKEPEQADAPTRLNFALVTGVVKIEQTNQSIKYEENLEILYEKLKYNHPPPFVTPPKKNFCNLLDIKLASKSIHSLLSRFSIDSRLSIKEKNMLQSIEHSTVASYFRKIENSKLVTLPSKKYFILRCLPNGFMPIRAINEQFIQNECIEKEKESKCKSDKIEIELIPENVSATISPIIIPCGPCIKTPDSRKLPDCPEKKDQCCSLNKKEKDDNVLKKLICSTENVVLEIMFPNFKENVETFYEEKVELTEYKPEVVEVRMVEQILYGFKKTDDENIGIINANSCLEDRATFEISHYKSCYFSSIICILTKIKLNVNKFHSDVLDKFIIGAKKINIRIGNLRYKMKRWFRNFYTQGVKCNVILKQVQYFDPENYESDSLECGLKSFLLKYQTGILVFGNVSYAFWSTNDIFYLFDSYACDIQGRISNDGFACLMEICDFKSFVNRIIENTGESVNKPYRLYTILVTHLEETRKLKKKRAKVYKSELKEDCLNTDEPKVVELGESESEISLIEKCDWVNEESRMDIVPLDTTTPKFLAFKNYNASILETIILNNEVERTRILFYDKKFYSNLIFRQSLDLCIIAWSQIYDPRIWKTQTIQALYESSKDYSLDSLLATEDSTVSRITDNLIAEFNIANYSFCVVFAPLHNGTLYACKGWNLAMSLKKIFNSPIYTGAILVSANVHIGIMRKDCRYYGWWLVKRTKSMKMIVSENLEDYLKLIIKEINKPNETEFSIRIITISYAKILSPNCSDIEGLHESVKTSTSDPEIHRKQINSYNLNDIFRPTHKPETPLFVLGSVALNERDAVIEPCIKRCYFVALFAVILKRDIIQNPLPGMIDKILELAESSYKLFEKPKYHTEHIIKGVSLMDRIFDLRDCAFQLVNLQDEEHNKKNNFIIIVRNQFKEFFKKYTSGIIQFSNCCYGFWYSKVYNCFYYLDPYPCDKKGRKVRLRGTSCLGIFSSICDMVGHMFINKYKETTGFFLHRIHVESVNSSPYTRFQEDPIWMYLDYHWSYRHTIFKKSRKLKKTNDQISSEKTKKLRWKNYMIEVPNLIYSLWGTVGVFDMKYNQSGKNQIAIAIAVFAMRNLCHPSEWSSTVLNTAVICGDYYYKKSKKVSSHCLNKFNLLEFLKISSFQWNVEFKLDVCGVLYGKSNERNLIDAIEMALKRSTNLLLECEKKYIAIIQTSDAFYATDSSWTGPPLFNNNRGAIYTIRCKNTNTLVYVITKMLNTNKKLKFILTPIKLIFKEDACQSKDIKFQINVKQLLEKPVYSVPGKIINHCNLVSGSIAVSDEDSYLCYNRSLKLGLTNRLEFEKSCTLMGDECEKVDCKLSVKKQNNKKISSVQNSKITQKFFGNAVSRDNIQSAKSFSSLLEKKIDYTRVLNLVNNTMQGSKCKKLHSKKKKFEKNTNFIYDATQIFFDKYNAEMKKDIYKNKEHCDKNK